MPVLRVWIWDRANRLIDGTVLQIAGTSKISDRNVPIDAMGVAAVRLNDKGRLETLAAGGLKHIKTGDFEISLDEPIDVALWTDGKGEWQGVLHSESGLLPEQFLRITKNWIRLRIPSPAEAK
jgi:hypothetical protein